MKPKKSKYIDNVLLTLRRQYSKDEYVAALLKRQSEVETELGITKSERDEFKYTLDKVLKLDPEVKSRFCMSQYVQNLKKEIKTLKDKVKELKSDNRELLDKSRRLQADVIYYKLRSESE